MVPLYFFLFLSCKQDQQEYKPVRYEQAELIPAFQHGNSGWAGVALLDYDGDGWLDIFFPNGLSQADSLYRNLGNGQFVDIAAEVGLDSREQHGAVSSGDLDNDGDPDLVIAKDCSLGTLSEEGLAIPDGAVSIYWNEGGVFRQQELRLSGQAEELGICPVSIELVDINQDGLLDISISNGLDLDQVYPWIFRKEVREALDVIQLNDSEHSFLESMPVKNFDEPDPGGDPNDPNNQNDPNDPNGSNEPNDPNQETAEDLSEIAFQIATFTAAYIDLNSDGKLDRIAGFGGGTLGIFIQRSEGMVLEWDRLSADTGLWMGFALADFDGNGTIDLYSTNQGLSPLMQGYDNIPWEYRAGIEQGPFGIRGVNPFHTLFDIDPKIPQKIDFPLEADHLLAGDLYEDENLYPEWSQPEDLQRLPWGWGAAAIDIDSDGWMDVAFNSNNCAAPLDIIGSEENGAGPGGILRNQNGQGFQDMTWEWGLANLTPEGYYPDGRGIAVGDLNNDGFPDLVFANRSHNPSQSGPMEQVFGVPNIFISKGFPNNWLQLDLVGHESNRDGIGSMITIDTGERKQIYIFEPGGTTNSSNERLFTVGIARAAKVNIEVLFPSGKTVIKENIAANQRITIEEE